MSPHSFWRRYFTSMLWRRGQSMGNLISSLKSLTFYPDVWLLFMGLAWGSDWAPVAGSQVHWPSDGTSPCSALEEALTADKRGASSKPRCSHSMTYLVTGVIKKIPSAGGREKYSLCKFKCAPRGAGTACWHADVYSRKAVCGVAGLTCARKSGLLVKAGMSLGNVFSKDRAGTVRYSYAKAWILTIPHTIHNY